MLLNAFPLSLQWHGDASIEVPPHQLSHGIRPLLFAMLRMDLLQKRHIRMCIREELPELFRGENRTKDCCSTECSVKVASKKRYALIVRPARQKASAKKKAAKSRRKEM